MAAALRLLLGRLTYANVVATLALFVALGGSSYAVSRISGSQIKNSSIDYRKLKRDTLGGTRIKEARLGKVPAARSADRIGGLGIGRLLLKCPAATEAVAGACVETVPRSPLAYGSAEGVCRGEGRRLASYEEVNGTVSRSDIALAPGGELTSEVFPSASKAGEIEALVVTGESGSVTVIPNVGEQTRAFRCASDPAQ